MNLTEDKTIKEQSRKISWLESQIDSLIKQKILLQRVINEHKSHWECIEDATKDGYDDKVIRLINTIAFMARNEISVVQTEIINM